MIQNLTIENFKALKHVKMKELANVNILLGKNNSGKTAVLEALFLFSTSYNPEGTLNRLYTLRGYKRDYGEEKYEEIWNSLFYNWDHSKEISIEAEEFSEEEMLIPGIEGLNKRILYIKSIIENSLDESNDIEIIESSDFMENLVGLLFEYRLADGDVIKREVKGLRPAAIMRANYYSKKEQNVVLVPARGMQEPDYEAIRYSQLEIANRHNDVLDALRIIEPELRRLIVVAKRRGGVIYGDIGYENPIPLPMMGDGMLHTLAIALAIANNKNGLVLIDEIENGLHHSVLTNVWKMIFQTSRKLNIQVFVATHSDECIKAAYEAVESLECYDSLKLYRFDKMKDRTRVEDYTAKELSYAIASEQEVR